MMKALFSHSSLHPHDSSRHCGSRAHVVGPIRVYTDEYRRGNGTVKMRPLTLPGRDQAIHSPEIILSNGESQTYVFCYEAVLVTLIQFLMQRRRARFRYRGQP